jgi:hypothetical protein
MRIGGKRCNCSCFEIDQEMDAILLIIGIVYGVCRIVIKSVQQCTDLLKIFVEYFKVPLLIRIEPKSEISNYSWSTDFHDYMFWKLVNSFKMMK